MNLDNSCLEKARKQYLDSIKSLETSIESLNSIYREQEQRMKAVTETLAPSTIAEMKAETEEMTRLLKALNSKYKEMLDVMSPKQK